MRSAARGIDTRARALTLQLRHDQWRCRLAARAAKVQCNLLWYWVGAPSFTIWRRAGRRSGIDHSLLGCS